MHPAMPERATWATQESAHSTARAKCGKPRLPRVFLNLSTPHPWRVHVRRRSSRSRDKLLNTVDDGDRPASEN